MDSDLPEADDDDDGNEEEEFGTDSPPHLLYIPLCSFELTVVLLLQMKTMTLFTHSLVTKVTTFHHFDVFMKLRMLYLLHR